MNCIRPWAPAELVRLLRPCPVSSMPMPASKVQGILYSSAAAMYRFLILAGMGSGGLCSESCRGRPGAGSRNPTPPSGAPLGGRGRRATASGCWVATAVPSSGAPRSAMNGTGSTGRPLISTWKWRWSPVLVPVEPSTPSLCADGDRGTGSDLGVDAGQVPVAGADAAAVAEGDDVAVPGIAAALITVPAEAATTGPAAGEGGQVLAGVQPPLLVDGVVAAAER